MITDFSSDVQPGENLTPGDIKNALKKSGAKSSQLWNIPIDDIGVIDGFNVRNETESYEDHIEGLAQSIMEQGFLLEKPLSGYVKSEKNSDQIVIFDGHSRLAAAKIARERGAPILTIPVVIKNNNNIVDLNCSLITNNNGRELTEIEKAFVVKRLQGFQMTQVEIARRTGLQRYKVNEFLTHLIPAPPIIHQWVVEEKITASFAVSQIRQHKENAVEKIRKMIDKAEKKGSAKATPRHAPDAVFKKYMRKRAPEMANLITKISENQALLSAIESSDPELFKSLTSVADEGKLAMKKMLEEN